jgi:hypothetical protein
MSSRGDARVPRLIALLAALCVLIAGPVSGVAQDVSGSGPNQVVDVESTSATTLARSGIQAGPTGADRATPTNLAIASAHDCTGCEARAAAFQAVFLTGDPAYVSPRNVAAATNAACESCSSFAFAYQYVITTDGPAHLSDAGRDRIDALRAEASQDVTQDGVTYDELDAELHELAQRFRAVIDGELQRTGVAVEDRQSHERHDSG